MAGTFPPRFQPSGTSQQDRPQPALLDSQVELVHAPVKELLAYIARLSTRIRYYQVIGGQVDSARNWNLAEQSELMAVALIARQRLSTQYAHFTRLVRQLEDPLALAHQRQRTQGQMLSQVYQMAWQFEQWWEVQQLPAVRNSLGNELQTIIEDLGGVLHQAVAVEQQLLAQGVWQHPLPSHPHRPQRLDHLWPAPETAAELPFDACDAQLKKALWAFYHAQSMVAALAERMFTQLVTELPHALGRAANMPPEIAMLVAFCKLFQHAQFTLNRIPRRQLDYYYQQELRMSYRPARPDYAYLVFALAKGVTSYVLPAGTAVEGDKDAAGHRPLFRTTLAQPLSPWRVQQLSTVFVSGHGTGPVQGIYVAPQANSADGWGKPLTDPTAGWAPFGEEQELRSPGQRTMTAAVVGFAVSAAVLLLQEGQRTIELDIDFTPESFAQSASTPAGHPSTLSFEDLARDAFRIEITGAAGWLPLRVEAVRRDPSGTGLTWHLALDRAQPAVVPHQAALHAGNFQSAWPVLRLVLDQRSPTYAYSALSPLQPRKICLRVRAQEVHGLQLSNQLGPLAAGLPFAPFGLQARAGAYLLVSYAEVFRKRLSQLTLHLNWAQLPSDPGGFAEYYQGYEPPVTNDSFRVAVSYRRDWRWVPSATPVSSKPLFQMARPLYSTSPVLSSTTELKLETAAAADFSKQPAANGSLPLPESATGSIRLELVAPAQGFGTDQYPALLVETMQYNARHANEPRPLPRAPYAPLLRSVELSYAAEEEFEMAALFGTPAPDQPQFYHVHPLAEYQPGRAAPSAHAARGLHLLPEFGAEGTLYLGLAQLAPPQKINLLFDLAPFGQLPHQYAATAGALDQTHEPRVEWSYLVGDEWQPFAAGPALHENTVRDESHGLTDLHPVYLTLPGTLDMRHTVMPDGLYWLRATVQRGVAAVSRVRAVHPQAVLALRAAAPATQLVEFTGRLPAQSLTRLVSPNPMLASVAHPLPSFDGQVAETKAAFDTRVSERLRHRGRAITPWDYEHVVLDQFPEVYQAKCLRANQLPAASRRPGQVVVVVMPSPPAATAGFQLPTFSPHQLHRMQVLLQGVAAPRMRLHVTNPFYELVQVRGRVRFTDEARLITPQPGALLERLQQELNDFLSPWGHLHGTVHRPHQGLLTNAAVRSFLNQRPYVAAVTAFSAVKMALEDDRYLFYDTAALPAQGPEAEPAVLTQDLDDLTRRPWSVYLSAGRHRLEEVTTDSEKQVEEPAQPAGIGSLTIGVDFVILHRFDPEPSAQPATLTPPVSTPDAKPPIVHG